MHSFYFDKSYRKNQSIQTKVNWQKGIYEFRKKREIKKCARIDCNNKFETKPSNPKKFCSNRCAAIVSNTGRFKIKEKRFCMNCGIELGDRGKIKFCSSKCHRQKQYKENIVLWKTGVREGGVGISTRNIAAWIRKYLFQKYSHKCARCGWCTKNPITSVAPLEIEHIDGNSENNAEGNLTLLCPNCHSLTPFYKNLNRGKGRKWRMDKYIKNT